MANGVESGSVVAVVRDPAKATALATRGAVVRSSDCNDPVALEEAFKGVDRLLFIFGSEVGRRVTQHRNVINAAKACGIVRIYYTSVLRAADNPMILAAEHKVTEQMLASSGAPHTILRHGWYTENCTAELPEAVSRGVLVHAAGD
ncbi:NAD(P)H-binding protein [Arthrobacter sp. A2-55]|nr:NAD(P)H-binding protein [Arthrobacter sp. A2-55]